MGAIDCRPGVSTMTETMPNFYPILMLAVSGLPLVLAISLAIKRWQSVMIRLIPWSASPALAAAAWVPSDATVSISWFLLKAHMGVDPTGRMFLLFTALLWLLAGIYAQSYLASDPRRVSFFFFFLLSMSGNLGLIASQDAVSFYVFFALMSFASYGLVVHNGDADALRAGRVYMVLVVVGEILLFGALILQTASVDSLLLKDFSNQRPSQIVVGLLLVGFGIKAGALPVHVWLPLAHPAAPTPASAVLSGAMIKAGLLGWLRFLPIGMMAMPRWGVFCIIAGLSAAYYAVAVGLTQRNPKTVLAYSSISQMGLITVGVGLAVGWPQTVTSVLPAIWIYALHHGFAKGALFLGVGVAGSDPSHQTAHRLALGGLILASLALAGAPITSGAVAKAAMKLPLKDFQGSWLYSLNWLMPLAAIGTTLLMARFLFIVTMRQSGHMKPHSGMWLSWIFTTLLSAAAVWMLPFVHGPALNALRPNALWQAIWPIGVGVLISGGAWLSALRKRRLPTISIPQGDLIYVTNCLYDRFMHVVSLQSRRIHQYPSSVLKGFQAKRLKLKSLRKLMSCLENRLADWQTAALIFVILIGCLFAWSLRL
jgi:multicomponent Na+:H+ antiporter subunit D